MIRFILTLNNVSTCHKASHLLSERRDYENSHAPGLNVRVCGSYHALGSEAARGTNHGRSLIVDRDRMDAGLSLSRPSQPDRQGVADASPTLRISDIDCRPASPLGGKIPFRAFQALAAAYHAANDPNTDTEQDVAGEDIDHDHNLAQNVCRLVIHESESRRHVNGVVHR